MFNRKRIKQLEFDVLLLKTNIIRIRENYDYAIGESHAAILEELTKISDTLRDVKKNHDYNATGFAKQLDKFKEIHDMNVIRLGKWTTEVSDKFQELEKKIPRYL